MLYSCFLRALPTESAWGFILYPPKDPLYWAGSSKGRPVWEQASQVWRQAGHWYGYSPTVPEHEEQSKSSDGIEAQLTDQTTSQACRNEAIQDQHKIWSDQVRIRAKRLEDGRPSTSWDWWQVPELRSCSTAKVDRTPPHTAVSHTTLSKHTYDSRSQSCMKPVVSLSLWQLNHRITETWNISSWKEACRIIKPNSLLLRGLLKT